MKKTFILSILVLFCFYSNAQIIFESGYFIDNNDERITCLIKNVDWKNNPTKFEYKLSEANETQVKSIQQVKEFGVIGQSKYVKFQVKINKSSDNPRTLEGHRDVVFEDEIVFLKTLIEGDATLFYYEKGNLNRFFFSIGTTEVEQLVYKRYYHTPENVEAERRLNRSTNISSSSIGENVTFRQQLWNSLKCKGILRKSIDKIAYRSDPLKKLFTTYNSCVDPQWVKEKKLKNSFLFHISIRPGVNYSSIKASTGNAVFDAKPSFRIGAEFEIVLPFNKNKWSFIFEPTYRNFQASEGLSSFYPETSDGLGVDYQSIEFLIGARHSLFFNDKSKIFISAYLLNDLGLSATVNTPREYEINPLSNFALGFGTKFKKRFSFEFRYDFPRELLKYNIARSEFKNVSLILGYTIL